MARIIFLLLRHLERDNPGVLGPDIGLKLKWNTDTVRAPDVAFMQRDRLSPNDRGFCNGPPDLAI